MPLYFLFTSAGPVPRHLLDPGNGKRTFLDKPPIYQYIDLGFLGIIGCPIDFGFTANAATMLFGANQYIITKLCFEFNNVVEEGHVVF